MRNNITKIICAVLIVAGLAVNVTSCKKDGATKNKSADTSAVALSTNVTEADAAQFAADAVSPANGGIADQLQGSVSIYKAVKLSCGVQQDTTIVKSSATGVTPSFNYSYGWNYTLNCNGTVPSQLTFNYTGNGSYNGSMMSADHKSNGQIIMTNFTTDSANYALTLAFTRVGTATSKLASKYTFASTLSIQSTNNIEVDKTSGEIVGGAATVTLVSTASNGKKFTYGGILTFQGGKKAILGFTSGKVYNITWN
jgi:hypothetical protein